MKTALLIFVILLATPQGEAGRFSKEGLAFDYPAGWTLADTGDAQLQRLTVAHAQAVSGNVLLRSASEEAARKAKFEPTTLCGKAVKVSGIVTYNFVLM